MTPQRDDEGQVDEGQVENGPHLMQRTRAAVTFLNGQRHENEGLNMAAFLDLFHPNLSDDAKRELINSKRR